MTMPRQASTDSSAPTRADKLNAWVVRACAVYVFFLFPILLFGTVHNCGAWGDSRGCKAPATASAARPAQSARAPAAAPQIAGDNDKAATQAQ